MKKKHYKEIPEFKSEQQYADFWNSVENVIDYLDPGRFKSVSPKTVLAKRYGTKTEV